MVLLSELWENVCPSLRNLKGKVFYSGQLAFRDPSRFYLLGINPGDLGDGSGISVEEHCRRVIEVERIAWSAICDEEWGGKRAGSASYQMRVGHFLRQLGLPVRRVPVSNLVFQSSKGEGDAKEWIDQQFQKSWAFHSKVIAALGVQCLFCIGSTTAKKFASKLNCKHSKQYDCRETDGQRRYRRAYVGVAPDRSEPIMILQLPHPTYSNWCNSAYDPSNWARSLIKTVLKIDLPPPTVAEFGCS